jgi:hypothetical protein
MLAVAIIGSLWLARGPILRAAAAALIMDNHEEGGDAVWLAGGDHRFETGAALYRENPLRTIIMVRAAPNRLVRLGILPSNERIGQAVLHRRGVPDEAIAVLENGAAPLSELQHWLRSHPEKRVILVCARFSSRRQSWALAKTLEPGERDRVHIFAVRDDDYDETNWWTSRTGVKEFFNAWLGQVYSWLGWEEEPQQPWDPDEYERDLAKAIEKRRG